MALSLVGVSAWWGKHFWTQPIWNPLVLLRVNDTIDSMPSVLGSPTVQFFATSEPIEQMLGLGSCGGGFFLMDDDLARRIEREGLVFFAGATKGRTYRERDRWTSRHSYAPWQETPLAASWNSEGIYTRGFQCMKSANEVVRAIEKAISNPGGYFTHRPGAEILVLPSVRLILLTFS